MEETRRKLAEHYNSLSPELKKRQESLKKYYVEFFPEDSQVKVEEGE